MRQVITTDFQPLDRCILTEHSALLKKKQTAPQFPRRKS